MRLAWLAGSIVPVDETVWVIVPVATVCTVVAVVMPVVAALELLVANQVASPAATRITTMAPMTSRFRPDPVL